MSFKHNCFIPTEIPYGEPLWPKKHTLEELEVLKVADPYTFSSQYQQRPSPLTGGIFKDEYFNYYSILPPDIISIVIYGDTAQKTAEHNDYSVFQVWAKSVTNKIYLIDQIRGKWEAPELERQLVDFWNKHKPSRSKIIGASCVKIEDKSSGSSLIQSIKEDNQIPIEGIQVSSGKLSRAMTAVKYFSSGFIHIPEHAEYISDYKQEFRNFTANDTHKHDDQIDTTLHAVDDLLVFSNNLYNMSSI